MSAQVQPVPSDASPVLILSGHDIRRLLPITDAIRAVEAAFRLYGEGAVPAPTVSASHVPNGGFHIKAGVMPFAGHLYFAAKTNANFPLNPSEYGLPTIQGLVLLFDAECGRPLAIMDAVEITKLRTAAATAVAAKWLARKDANTMTIIGCGAQSRAQLAALLAVLPIRAVFAYDIDIQRARAFAEAARREHNDGIDVEVADDVPSATLNSDVVVTCTTARTPFLLPQHIRPGTFIAAVGADNEDKQELDPQLLAGNMVVPDVVQQSASIGELHHAIAAGLVDARSITTDLGRIVARLDPGRASDEQITIFDSTGMALQDVAAAATIYTAHLNATAV